MASYNTSGITSYTDTSSIAGISAASGQNYGSSSSGLMSSSSSKGRNLDADMYAGSKYAPTSNAGTAQANQSFTAFATSSDDDNDYTPAALALQFEAAGATLPAAINPMDRFRDTMASSLYDSDIFKPYVPDPTEEIESYLANTAVEDAIKEALGIDDTERQIYQGIPTQEEPEPNIDMSILQEAMMPEPITVEKLEVKAGDTLSSIAAENNLPVQDVIDANPQIKNPNMIRPGEMVSMPEAWQIASDGRAELIMKGVEKLFGLFPPKSAAEKKAKSELQYFLDAGQKLADSSDGYPSWFKYIPDKIQLADYIVDKMNRNLESTIRESAEIDAAKRDASGITRSLTPEEVAERNKAIGAMNFSDRSALTNMDNLQLVDIEDETGSAGLMTRPKARPEGLRALSEPEKNKAAQKYLGITADGIWGKGSTRKLAGWQYQNGVPVSGVLDEATIKAMENPETEDPRKEITRKSVLNTAGTAPDISKVKDWAKENIKDPMRAAAFVATVEAETGGRELVESGHTVKSAVRTFVTNNRYMHEGNDVTRPLTAKGKRRKQKLEALGSNATGDEIFDFIYGPDTDAVGGYLGNTSATDGSKYKGRGLVQITGKDNYQRVGDIIGVDLVNNPELVKDPKYAAAAAMAYLTLPGKDFFDGTLTSDKLASAIGHTGSAATRWSRATALKNEMYP